MAQTSANGVYDVAIVIPTIRRTTLEQTVRSVFAQDLAGTIQILIGVDVWDGDRGRLATLVAEAPANCSVVVFDPGYSTAVRHGGFSASGDGGALRTILSYAARSRLVAYLDGDNWWAADHLSTLTRAVAGHDWAFSWRWYAHAERTRRSAWTGGSRSARVRGCSRKSTAASSTRVAC